MERRESRRVTVDLEVDYAINQHARAVNLSESGIRLVTGKFMTKGTILFLVVHLPEEPLRVIGEVCWSKSDIVGNFENGIKFSFIDGNHRKKLKTFLENYEKDFIQAVGA
jgi:Tfp pilus assembly protein PilZ